VPFRVYARTLVKLGRKVKAENELKKQKMEQNQPKQLQIKVSGEDLKGRYSNLMQISHSKEEFVLDFLSAFMPAGALVSRIIVSPGHLKRMANALQANLKKYEDQFGGVEAAKEPESKIGFTSGN
jgi:hypothetical protein